MAQLQPLQWNVGGAVAGVGVEGKIVGEMRGIKLALNLRLLLA